ncbi:hypothetical protein ACFWBX_11950 [Streptomyces sp. NPDC059991]|uniref:hypothetical protein n=1 Tax=Streptomyces sp. NPDC059991 TaxID=3347028 RepID=UPI0036AF3692
MSAPRPAPARSASRREVVLRVILPDLPGCTAMLGTDNLGALLVHGAAPTRSPFVWPLVVLALGAMAYDVALRAMRRREG